MIESSLIRKYLVRVKQLRGDQVCPGGDRAGRHNESGKLSSVCYTTKIFIQHACQQKTESAANDLKMTAWLTAREGVIEVSRDNQAGSLSDWNDESSIKSAENLYAFLRL